MINWLVVCATFLQLSGTVLGACGLILVLEYETRQGICLLLAGIASASIGVGMIF